MQLNSPKNLPKVDRPREKLQKLGVESLSTAQLLQVLLGTGSAGHNVAQIAESVHTVLQAAQQVTLPRLVDISGISLAKAGIILAAIELGKRMYDRSQWSITKPADILPLCRKHADQRQEYLVCFTLSGANAIIAERVISVGILDSTLIHPREVFAEAIQDRAAAIIIVHNHPSRVPTPSPADVAVTERLKQAGEILGIKLLDHLIVTKDNGYYSFAGQKELP